MNDSPYFSLIVPSYNVERYIKLCITSILLQTFQDFELIIVDDASSDNSYEICQELISGNEKVQLFRQEKNSGPSSARNFGLRRARGKFIWFIDSDDVIFPNSLDQIHQIIQRVNEDVDALHAKSAYHTAQNDDQPIDSSMLTLRHESNPSVGFLTEDLQKRLLENWTINRIWGFPWNTIYRREFLSENGLEFLEDCYSEDNIFNLMVMCLAQKYLMVPGTIYVYRVYPDSYSHKARLEFGLKSLLKVESRLKSFLDKIPALDGNRILKEKCIIQILDAHLRDHARPFYGSFDVAPEVDKTVYDELLPTFGENTALVKYLFHGFNSFYQQANFFLRQRNYLLIEQEKKIQQMSELLEQQRRLIQQIAGH